MSVCADIRRLPLHPPKWPAVNEDLHAGHISSEPPVRWRLWPSPPQCCCNTTEKGSYGATNTFAFCHQATVQVFKFLINWMGMNANHGRSCFILPASSMQIQGIALPHFTDGHRKPLKLNVPRRLPLQYLQEFYYGVKKQNTA